MIIRKLAFVITDATYIYTPFLNHRYVNKIPPTRRNIPTIIPIPIPIPVPSKFSVSLTVSGNERNIIAHNANKDFRYCKSVIFQI